MTFFDLDTAKVALASVTGLSNWYIETLDIWLKWGISFFSLVYIIVKLHQLITNKGR